MLGSVTAVIVVISIAIGALWAAAGPTGRDRDVIAGHRPCERGPEPGPFFA